MGSMNSQAYRTNGTSALKSRANYSQFTYVENSCDSYPELYSEPVAEHLSLIQKIKAIASATFVIAALFFIMYATDARRQAAFESSLANVAQATITVKTGDSLWDIAQERVPSGMDVETTVRWIQESNNLESSLIVAGQQLIVPAA